MVESAALWLWLRRRTKSLNDRYVLDGALRAFGASIPMGAAALIAARLLNGRNPLLVLLAGTAAGLITFELSALAFGLPEARTIPAALLRRFRRGS
jgi:hypothetical protein